MRSYWLRRDHFSEGTDPNAAFAQVASLASADLYELPPGTVPPMVMLYDPTAPLPTAYLAASSDVLDETKVYELAGFNVRNMLQGTPDVIAPAVFGGKLRRIYGELDPLELHAPTARTFSHPCSPRAGRNADGLALVEYTVGWREETRSAREGAVAESGWLSLSPAGSHAVAVLGRGRPSPRGGPRNEL